MVEIGVLSKETNDLEYLKWMSKNGIKLKKCSIGHFPSTGRGCIATDDILKDQVLIEVPDNMVLLPDSENVNISERLLETLYGHRGGENTKNESIGLALALVGEKLALENSNWSGYIASLPNISEATRWKLGRADEMKKSALFKMPSLGVAPDGWSGEDDVATDVAFREAALPLLEDFSNIKNNACENSSQKNKRPKTLSSNKKKLMTQKELKEVFEWALCIVASYSFELGDEQFHGMVPFFDMLNHITGGVNVRLHHDNEKGVLQMISTKKISKGEEIVNCYGPHSQLHLMRCYGYTDSHLLKSVNEHQRWVGDRGEGLFNAQNFKADDGTCLDFLMEKSEVLADPFHAGWMRCPEFVQNLYLALFEKSADKEKKEMSAFDKSIDCCQFLYELKGVCLAPQNGWLKPSLVGAVHDLFLKAEDQKGADSELYDEDDKKSLLRDFREFVFIASLIFLFYRHEEFLKNEVLTEDRVSSFLDNEMDTEEFMEELFEKNIFDEFNQGDFAECVSKVLKDRANNVANGLCAHETMSKDALKIMQSEWFALCYLSRLFSDSETQKAEMSWVCKEAFCSYLEVAKRRAAELNDGDSDSDDQDQDGDSQEGSQEDEQEDSEDENVYGEEEGELTGDDDE